MRSFSLASSYWLSSFLSFMFFFRHWPNFISLLFVFFSNYVSFYYKNLTSAILITTSMSFPSTCASTVVSSSCVWSFKSALTAIFAINAFSLSLFSKRFCPLNVRIASISTFGATWMPNRALTAARPIVYCHQILLVLAAF